MDGVAHVEFAATFGFAAVDPAGGPIAYAEEAAFLDEGLEEHGAVA